MCAINTRVILGRVINTQSICGRVINTYFYFLFFIFYFLLHILFAHEIFFSWTLQLKIQKNSEGSIQIFLAEEENFFTGLDDFVKKIYFTLLGYYSRGAKICEI